MEPTREQTYQRRIAELKAHGTWCFRAELSTLFKIDSSRGSEVLLEMLGKEFNGVLGCDYFSA